MTALPSHQRFSGRAFFRARFCPVNAVILVGALACACSLGGFAGRLWWLLDLTVHFRLQYAVLLSALAPVCFLVHRRLPAAVFLGFALVNWAVVIPQCWLGRAASVPSAKPLKLMLLNVHAENQRYELVRRCIREQSPDLMVLEEMTEPWFQALAEERTNYPYSICDLRDDDFGIALFSRIPLQSSNIVFLGDAELPSAKVTFEWQGKPVTLLGIHPLPPGGAANSRARNVQLNAAAAELSRCNGPALLLGDLNTTPWSYSFQDLLRQGRLKDSSLGHGVQPTWPTFLPLMYIPLDHCLISSDWQIITHRLGPRVGSDHLPLVVELDSGRP